MSRDGLHRRRHRAARAPDEPRGRRAPNGKDTLAAKIEALEAAGIHVVDSPAALGSTLVKALTG